MAWSAHSQRQRGSGGRGLSSLVQGRGHESSICSHLSACNTTPPSPLSFPLAKFYSGLLSGPVPRKGMPHASGQCWLCHRPYRPLKMSALWWRISLLWALGTTDGLSFQTKLKAGTYLGMTLQAAVVPKGPPPAAPLSSAPQNRNPLLTSFICTRCRKWRLVFQIHPPPAITFIPQTRCSEHYNISACLGK